VTLRSCTPGRAHEAHSELDKVDRDDEEVAKRAEPNDCFGLEPAHRDAADDELAPARLVITLALLMFPKNVTRNTEALPFPRTHNGQSRLRVRESITRFRRRMGPRFREDDSECREFGKLNSSCRPTMLPGHSQFTFGRPFLS
jgi:hypothetical protein